MAKNDKLQNITDKIAKFIAQIINKAKELFEKIKKMDRRFLILIGVAVVLVIVLFILIVNGISKIGDDKKPIESEGMSGNITEITTDAEPVDVLPYGAGIYKVQTGTSSHLNMRESANKNSDRVGQIPNGTAVEVLFVDDTDVKNGGDYGWGYVSYDGVRGWVYMEYLIK